MTSFRIDGTTVTFEGKKFHDTGAPVIGCYVQLIRNDTSALVGVATTDKTGYWTIVSDTTTISDGRYDIKFIGSKMIQKFEPLGNWEEIDVAGVGGDQGTIEPADVDGLLNETHYAIDATTHVVRYSVAVNATKIVFENSTLSTITGISLTSISTQTDEHTLTDSYSLLTGLVATLDGSSYNFSDTFSVAPSGVAVIRLLPPNFIAGAYKIKLTGSNINATGLSVRVPTRLAAHEIDAGRIRVEDSISISKGGTRGVFLDNDGIYCINGLDKRVVSLYNTPQIVGNTSGVYANIGGWLTSESGLTRDTGSAKIVMDASPSPFIAVGSGLTEYARMGILTGTTTGLWGTVGGFGGTGYTSAKVFINENGVYVKDTNDVKRTFFGVTATADADSDGWRNTSFGSDLVTNGSFETALGSEWVATGNWAISQGAGGATGGGSFRLDATSDGNAGSVYQIITGITTDKTYNFSFYTKGTASSAFTVNLYQFISGVYQLVKTYNSYANTTWNKTTFSFYSSTNAGDFKFEIAGSPPSGEYLNIDLVTCRTYEFFSDLSSQGLYVFSSPASYIRIGKGKFEIVGQDISINNLTVTGTLNVQGGVSTIASVSTGPIIVTNSSGLLPNYGGLEVDNTNGPNPAILYDATTSGVGWWNIGYRTSGNTTTGLSTGTFTLYPIVGVSGVVPYTKGDMLYASAASRVMNKLPIGGDNTVLTAVSGIPSWQLFNMEIYGDGSDSNVVVSGVVTLVRDMFYNNLTVTSTGVLQPDGWRVFVKNTLVLSGMISESGVNGANGTDGGNASAGVHGSAGTNAPFTAAKTDNYLGRITTALPDGNQGKGGLGGTAGSDGQTASAIVGPLLLSIGTTGAAGGAGGDGYGGTLHGAGSAARSGGTITALPAANGGVYQLINILLNRAFTLTGVSTFRANGIAAGGGGGGSGGFSQSGASDAAKRYGGGGGGGGGGSNGGTIVLAAKSITGNGLITVRGGDGGKGGNGGNAYSDGTVDDYVGGGGGGGGAGGGGGGILGLVYSSIGSSVRVSYAGGTAGTGGSGGLGSRLAAPEPLANGSNGPNGGSGPTGYYFPFKM